MVVHASRAVTDTAPSPTPLHGHVTSRLGGPRVKSIRTGTQNYRRACLDLASTTTHSHHLVNTVSSSRHTVQRYSSTPRCLHRKSLRLTLFSSTPGHTMATSQPLHSLATPAEAARERAYPTTNPCRGCLDLTIRLFKASDFKRGVGVPLCRFLRPEDRKLTFLDDYLSSGWLKLEDFPKIGRCTYCTGKSDNCQQV